MTRIAFRKVCIKSPWSIPLICIVSIFAYSYLGADPAVIRVLEPEWVNWEIEEQDNQSFRLTIEFNKELDRESIDINDLEIVGTAGDATGKTIAVQFDRIYDETTYYEVRYYIGPLDFEGNGTYSVRIVEGQLLGTGDSPKAIPPGEIATFEQTITKAPEIFLLGRNFIDTRESPSLEEPEKLNETDPEPWEINPGLHLYPRLEIFEDGEWQFYDRNKYYLAYGDIANIGHYEFTIRKSGLYRLANYVNGKSPPWPEWVLQVVGDPAREGAPLDHTRHFTATREMDGTTHVLNFSYIYETASPEANLDTAEEDEAFRVLVSDVDVLFDVLNNDTVNDQPVQSGDLTIIGVDFVRGFSSKTLVERGKGITCGSTIRTDGQYVYYSPECVGQWGIGWETFFYTVEDAQGNRDFGEVRAEVVDSSDLLVAVDDQATVGFNFGSTKINVLQNDTIRPPLTREAISITDAGPATQGGNVTFEDQKLFYSPPEGLAFTDSFTYTISDGGTTSTATVNVIITDDSLPVTAAESAMLQTLLSFLHKHPLGGQYLDLINQHRAEVVYLIKDQGLLNQSDRDPSALPSRFSFIRSGGNTETQQLTEAIMTDFLPGVTATLAGKGETVTVTQPMIDQLKSLESIVLQSASPQLAADIALVNGQFNNLQDFVGKTFNESIEHVGFDPASISLLAMNPQFKDGKFSLTTFQAVGLVFKLWRSTTLAPDSWQEVSEVESIEEGYYRTLTDPAPDPERMFYRITNELKP